jgi:hypothetical protein
VAAFLSRVFQARAHDAQAGFAAAFPASVAVRSSAKPA